MNLVRTQEIKDIVSDIRDNTEVYNILSSLSDRWIDERHYEDFKEYEDHLKKRILELYPKLNLTKIYKRPFGFLIEFEEKISFRIFLMQDRNHNGVASEFIGETPKARVPKTVHTRALDIIQKHNEEKDEQWCRAQLNRALDNINFDMLTDEIVNGILKGEFGITI